MMGGFTQQVRNPDSWEGWYWGAKHVWGQGFQGMMSPAANLIKDISENCRHGPQVGLRRGDHSLGLHRPVRQPHLAVLDPGRHQAGLHLPRPQLRRRRPRRQVDPGAAEHRRRSAAGHHLRVADRRHLGQGVRRDPRGRHGQGRRLRAGRRRRGHPQDARVGFARSAACPSGPSRPWPGSSPRTPPPSSTTSAARPSAVRTRTSPAGWNASSWACRGWAVRASISAR